MKQLCRPDPFSHVTLAVAMVEKASRVLRIWFAHQLNFFLVELIIKINEAGTEGDPNIFILEIFHPPLPPEQIYLYQRSSTHLFPLSNFPLGDDDDLAVLLAAEWHNFGHAVGVARVVDVSSRTPAHRGIDNKSSVVNAEHVNSVILKQIGGRGWANWT